MTIYNPEDAYIGGYTPNDGTIEFYSRIKAITKPEHTVLDMGAGRGAWFEDDVCEYRRLVRSFKGHVKEFIATDIDEAVLQNRSSDRNIVTEDRVPLEDHSVDIIIADYVLEHVQDPVSFVSEVKRLLKPKGIFCARTPHKYNYISLGGRSIPNKKHTNVLKNLQPDRKSQDVFDTAYKLNTVGAIQRHFFEFSDHSYVFRTDPSYYFGNQRLYRVLEAGHRMMPIWFSGNIFAFLRRK